MSEETKHTDKPWSFTASDETCTVRLYGPGGEDGGKQYLGTIKGEYWDEEAGDNYPDYEQDKANAQLIVDRVNALNALKGVSESSLVYYKDGALAELIAQDLDNRGFLILGDENDA